MRITLGNQARVRAGCTPPTTGARLARFLATPQPVLFASALPLGFAPTVRLKHSDGSLAAQALVVALQYHNGRTAVAARFTRDVPNWIVKP
jgi:hypothetical protein